MTFPEDRARQEIDALLQRAGWQVQNKDQVSLSAARGVAVREYPLAAGQADYVLFVDRKALGVVEAKKALVEYSCSLLQSSRVPSSRVPFTLSLVQ